jgi:hypothetical protein
LFHGGIAKPRPQLSSRCRGKETPCVFRPALYLLSVRLNSCSEE